MRDADFEYQVQQELQKLRKRDLLIYEGFLVLGMGFLWAVVLTQPLWPVTGWLVVLSQPFFVWFGIRAYRRWKASEPDLGD